MNDQLRTLADEYWNYLLEVNPTQALMLGDHRFDDKMESASREAEDEQIRRLRGFVDRASRLENLEADEAITRDVLIHEASTTATELEARTAEYDVNHTTGLQALLPVIIPQLPLEEPEHAEALVLKYRALGRALDEMTGRLREGVAGERTPPALTTEKTVQQLDALLGLPLEANPLLNVRVPAAFDEAREAAWKDELAGVVESVIGPAVQRYRDTIVNEVLPVARPQDRSGTMWIPGGDEFYRNAIVRYTTLPLDPEEIHEIGLSQVERLSHEYRTLGREVLGTDDLEEIYGRLREDADLHFDSGVEVREAAEAALSKAKAAMKDWFGRLPRADCVVGETPSGPTAFYFPPAVDGSRPGTFFVNTANPADLGRFELEALAYHEGIPGHHLQLAIAQELEDVAEFRKHAVVAAYAEGWGLYTERLADEMGLYTGPLERIGMLSADSMRAGRLVVDTGIHAKGWSRSRAIEFLVENSPMAVGTIENEVDRYIGMPGQALAYMIGRLEIQKLRAEAEDVLGERFDIKGFHDTVLGSGMVTLRILRRLVEEWTAATGSVIR